MRRFLVFLLFAISSFVAVSGAGAVEPIRVPLDSKAIDLTQQVEHYSGEGDRLQVSTAPGADGIVRRIEVSAAQQGTQPAWIVFALAGNWLGTWLRPSFGMAVERTPPTASC